MGKLKKGLDKERRSPQIGWGTEMTEPQRAQNREKKRRRQLKEVAETSLRKCGGENGENGREAVLQDTTHGCLARLKEMTAQIQ